MSKPFKAAKLQLIVNPSCQKINKKWKNCIKKTSTNATRSYNNSRIMLEVPQIGSYFPELRFLMVFLMSLPNFWHFSTIPVVAALRFRQFCVNDTFPSVPLSSIFQAFTCLPIKLFTFFYFSVSLQLPRETVQRSFTIFLVEWGCATGWYKISSQRY